MEHHRLKSTTRNRITDIKDRSIDSQRSQYHGHGINSLLTDQITIDDYHRSIVNTDIKDESSIRHDIGWGRQIKSTMSHPLKRKPIDLSGFKRMPTQLGLPSLNTRKRRNEVQGLEFTLEQKKRQLIDMQDRLKTDYYFLGRSTISQYA